MQIFKSSERVLLYIVMINCFLHRYFLKGYRKGQSEIFVDNLPGLPDNIRSNGKGGYFIVLASPIRTVEVSIGTDVPILIMKKQKYL